MEFARGTRARKALGATSWPGAFSSLIARNRRRYGGYVVHASIVLLAIGIAGSSAFDSVAEARLARGESMEVGDYRARLPIARRAHRRERDRDPRDARRHARRRDLGTLEAGKNAYTIEEQVSNEVGIRSDPLTGEDLFVIAEQIDPDGTRVLPRLRQAARQPHLDRRARLPPRLGDRAVAGCDASSGGSSSERGESASRRPVDPRLGARRRCSRSSASSRSRFRSSASPIPSRTPSTSSTRPSGGVSSCSKRAIGRSPRSRSSSSTTGPGTVSDEDYRALVGPLRRDAATRPPGTRARERRTPGDAPTRRDVRPASETREMRRRLSVVVGLALALVLAAPPPAEDPDGGEGAVDQRIAELQAEIAASKAAGGRAHLSALGGRGPSSVRLRRRSTGAGEPRTSSKPSSRPSASRLERLDRAARAADAPARAPQAEYATRGRDPRSARAGRSTSTEPPDVLSFLVSASSFDEIDRQLEFMNRIGRQDQRIASQVEQREAGGGR